MAKFSGSVVPAQTFSAVTSVGPISTYEGGQGFIRDAESELFLLAVTNMVREDTFYESAKNRDDRFVHLVHSVTRTNPGWVRGFVPWLRNEANMRTASLVAAAEYVAAGGEKGRQVVTGALKRADEPGEMLAYWLQTHGRKVPQPVKRGVADSVQRLYTEANAVKYDGQAKAWRMADVVELVHPKPVGAAQSMLFKWLLDSRHGRGSTEGLAVITADRDLLALPESERRANLGRIGEASWTWERLSGWLPGGMDAEAWEAVVPQMGYMALLRNLANFDKANVSDATAAKVGERLADPEQVARSRQFPLRFLSAYKTVVSERWRWPLQRAVDASLVNVPRLKGRSLILVDISGSMADTLSGRSQLRRCDAAALFGASLAKASESADLVAYNTSGYEIPFQSAHSVLKLSEEIVKGLGGGTATDQAVQALYKGHDRVVILTDEQSMAGPDLSHIPLIYTFNLAGYRAGGLPSGRDGRHTFGGLSDAAFKLLAVLEDHRDGGWPFVVE